MAQENELYVSVMGLPVTKHQAYHYALFLSNMGRMREILRNANQLLLGTSPEASPVEWGSGEILPYPTPVEVTHEERYLKLLFGTFMNNIYFMNIDEHRTLFEKNIEDFIFDDRLDALDREDTVIAFKDIPAMEHLDVLFKNNAEIIARYLIDTVGVAVTEAEAFSVFVQHFIAVAQFILNSIYPESYNQYPNELVAEALSDMEKENPFLPKRLATLNANAFSKLSTTQKCLLGEIAWQQSNPELLIKTLMFDNGSYYKAFQKYYRSKKEGGLGFFPDNLFGFNVTIVANTVLSADEFLGTVFTRSEDEITYNKLFSATRHIAMLYPNFVEMVVKYMGSQEAREVFLTILNLREMMRTQPKQ